MEPVQNAIQNFGNAVSRVSVLNVHCVVSACIISMHSIQSTYRLYNEIEGCETCGIYINTSIKHISVLSSNIASPNGNGSHNNNKLPIKTCNLICTISELSCYMKVYSVSWLLTGVLEKHSEL